jgi:RNA polymerase-binding transcription factor
LSTDLELLQQRVSSRQEKLDQATGALDLARTRFDSSSAAYEAADRERRRVKSALKLAKERADRLAKEAQRTKKLAREAETDRDDAENELAEHTAVRDKRQAKLAKSLASLEAAKTAAAASERGAPAKKATSRTASTRKQPAAKASPAKKSPAKRAAPTKRATPASKAAKKT